MAEIVSTTTKRYTARTKALPEEGGVAVLMTTNGDEKLADFVTVEFLGEEGNVDRVHIPPEALERAAAIMARLRDETAGDYRMVCPEHGYREGYSFSECPKCEAEQATPEPPAAPPAEPPTVAGYRPTAQEAAVDSALADPESDGTPAAAPDSLPSATEPKAADDGIFF